MHGLEAMYYGDVYAWIGTYTSRLLRMREKAIAHKKKFKSLSNFLGRF